MKFVIFILPILFVFTLCSAQSKPTYDLLQGKWQSIDDKTNILVFEKNHRKEIVAGMSKWDDEVFILSHSCKNSSDKDSDALKEQDRYISVIQSDLCWYINEVSSTKLSLTYIGRGNTLVYKRVATPATNQTSHFFSDTKKFCDNDGYWYYLVTIDGTKITIQSYPGKNNSSHKNKTKATETIVGKVKDGKIIVNGQGSFRYENGIFYSMNNEGQFESFKECR